MLVVDHDTIRLVWIAGPPKRSMSCAATPGTCCAASWENPEDLTDRQQTKQAEQGQPARRWMVNHLAYWRSLLGKCMFTYRHALVHFLTHLPIGG